MILSIAFFLSCLIFGQNLISIEAGEKNGNHSVSWGTRGFDDIHIQNIVVFKKSSLFRKVTDDYTWEQKNVRYPWHISQVVVTDQYRNGKGGYATLSAGGPNHKFVKIHFTSKRKNRGFNFIVDIYVR